jgi:putative nucleotidyltransferase with HDIG domain
MESKSSSEQNLHGDALKRELLKGLGSLLPMPQVVLKVQKLLLDPNSSFDEITGIIESDKDMVLKTLKVANSAYYGLRSEVSSVQRACLILGFSVIGEIIMAVGTSRFFSKPLKGYNMKPKALWQHSLKVALGARVIANTARPALANAAFLSGLYHDVGKIILDEHIFERKAAFEKFLGNGQESFLNAEKQTLGLDHAGIAGELCKRWKFPDTLTTAIRQHHDIDTEQPDELAFIVYAADNLMKMGTNGNESQPHKIDNNIMKFLAIDQKDIFYIMDEINESVNKMSEEIF